MEQALLRIKRTQWSGSEKLQSKEMLLHNMNLDICITRDME